MWIKNLPTSAGGITSGSTVIVGGTQGSVLFVGAGSVITQDNDNFFWDDTNNFLGIGTAAAPVSPLHVAGSISPAANANAAIATTAGTIVEAGSGAHALLAGLSITAPTITAGAATVTNTASLYIAGAPSATVTGANYAVWVDDGNVRTDGVILASDGSASAPSYAFQSDPDTGIYWASANQLRIAAGSDNIAFFSTVNILGALPTIAGGQADFQVAAGASGGQLFLIGRRAAGDSVADIILAPAVSRTAGSIIGISSTASASAHTFLIRYNGGIEVAQQAATSGTPPECLDLVGAAHTGLTASAEAFDVRWDLSRTVTFATGALTTQRAVYIDAPSYAFAGASTLTNPVTVDIGSAPGIADANANATYTSPRALRVGADSVTIGPTSAGLNYAAIGIPDHTVTVSGTTQVTSACGFAALNIGVPSLFSAAASPFDVAATVYIAGAPVSGGSATITDAYALFIDDGASRFDGAIYAGLGSTSAASYSFTNGATQDPNTGMYSPVADAVALVAGGTQRINCNGTGIGFNAATPIARPDYTVTNPSTSRTLDVGAATLAELRAVVGTMIQDNIDYGLYQ